MSGWIFTGCKFFGSSGRISMLLSGRWRCSSSDGLRGRARGMSCQTAQTIRYAWEELGSARRRWNARHLRIHAVLIVIAIRLLLHFLSPRDDHVRVVVRCEEIIRRRDHETVFEWHLWECARFALLFCYQVEQVLFTVRCRFASLDELSPVLKKQTNNKITNFIQI